MRKDCDTPAMAKDEASGGRHGVSGNYYFQSFQSLAWIRRKMINVGRVVVNVLLKGQIIREFEK